MFRQISLENQKVQVPPRFVGLYFLMQVQLPMLMMHWLLGYVSQKKFFIFLKLILLLLAIPNIGMLPSSKLDVLFLIQLLLGLLLVLMLGNIVVGSVSSMRV